MTRPIRVIPRRESFARLLVWHPINTDPHDPNRWNARIWLPAYDVLVILAGWRAYVVGSPILNRLFPHTLVDSVALVFAALGLITLISVVIPKLWRVEIAGKMGISFLLTTYALLVLSFPGATGADQSFAATVMVMASWAVYPRLTKLFIEGHKRRLAKRAGGA